MAVRFRQLSTTTRAAEYNAADVEILSHSEWIVRQLQGLDRVNAALDQAEASADGTGAPNRQSP
jgi:hypothetical protein